MHNLAMLPSLLNTRNYLKLLIKSFIKAGEFSSAFFIFQN
jgi:hypothetical protein